MKVGVKVGVRVRVSFGEVRDMVGVDVTLGTGLELGLGLRLRFGLGLELG